MKVPVEMQPILRSSNLHAAGYDETTQTLYIQFKGGLAYQYAGVSAETVEEFRQAESMGKYFHAHIRTNEAYEATQIQIDE